MRNERELTTANLRTWTLVDHCNRPHSQKGSVDPTCLRNRIAYTAIRLRNGSQITSLVLSPLWGEGRVRSTENNVVMLEPFPRVTSPCFRGRQAIGLRFGYTDPPRCEEDCESMQAALRSPTQRDVESRPERRDPRRLDQGRQPENGERSQRAFEYVVELLIAQFHGVTLHAAGASCSLGQNRKMLLRKTIACEAWHG